VDKAKSEARLDKLKAEAKVGKDGEELDKAAAKGVKASKPANPCLSRKRKAGKQKSLMPSL